MVEVVACRSQLQQTKRLPMFKTWRFTFKYVQILSWPASASVKGDPHCFVSREAMHKLPTCYSNRFLKTQRQSMDAGGLKFLSEYSHMVVIPPVTGQEGVHIIPST